MVSEGGRAQDETVVRIVTGNGKRGGGGDKKVEIAPQKTRHGNTDSKAAASCDSKDKSSSWDEAKKARRRSEESPLLDPGFASASAATTGQIPV